MSQLKTGRNTTETLWPKDQEILLTYKPSTESSWGSFTVEKRKKKVFEAVQGHKSHTVNWEHSAEQIKGKGEI